MKVAKAPALILAALILLTACGSPGPRDTEFRQLVPEADLNRSILLDLVSQDDPGPGILVTIQLRNTSNLGVSSHQVTGQQVLSGTKMQENGPRLKTRFGSRTPNSP